MAILSKTDYLHAVKIQKQIELLVSLGIPYSEIIKYCCERLRKDDPLCDVDLDDPDDPDFVVLSQRLDKEDLLDDRIPF